MYYDKERNPISFKQWVALLNDSKYQRVAGTILTSSEDLSKTYNISTIWTGASWEAQTEDPLIFETMVFDSDDGAVLQQRYSSIEQARAGHSEVVTDFAAKLKDPIAMEPK